MLVCITADMHPHELVRQALTAAATGRTARCISSDPGVPERTVAHWIRGDRRAPGPAPTKCPRRNGGPPTVAYSYLLGAYLGDGHLTVGHCTACLWMYRADDRPGVRTEVADAMAAVMPTSRVSVAPRTGCSAVKSFSLHWLCLFPQHAPARSIPAESCWSCGNRTSWRLGPAPSCAATSWASAPPGSTGSASPTGCRSRTPCPSPGERRWRRWTNTSARSTGPTTVGLRMAPWVHGP